MIFKAPEKKDEAETSRDKSLREAAAREKRKNREHAEMVASGKAIDLTEAHKRCFESGNSGVTQLKGW